VSVIPVLVDGQREAPVDLPDDLQPLRQLQWVELRDARWDADVDALLDVVSSALRPSPVSWKPWMAWVAGLLAVLAAMGLWFRFGPVSPPLRSVQRWSDSGQVRVECGGTEVLAGGGCFCPGGALASSSPALPSAWQCDGSCPQGLRAVALCQKLVP
jgi:hypothetical protein